MRKQYDGSPAVVVAAHMERIKATALAICVYQYMCSDSMERPKFSTNCTRTQERIDVLIDSRRQTHIDNLANHREVHLEQHVDDNGENVIGGWYVSVGKLKRLCERRARKAQRR